MSDEFQFRQEPAPAVGARIEGGVDAIVIGGTIDGMVAAAYLGRAGLKTVLLEAGLYPPELRPFTPGYFADDGDFLVRELDPEVVSSLDLYRHGLSYVQRRFDTVYYFADKSALFINGDLFQSFESINDMNSKDGEAFKRFAEEMLEAARELRPFFYGEPLHKLSKRTKQLFTKFGSASLEHVLDQYFSDHRVKDLLVAEASLRSALKPSDPHSFLSLLRRWSGEAAGLQAACALSSGGYSGLFDALRRAVQGAGVDIRAGADIQSLLVEWDGVAGVAMQDGGQIRAPIVVNALNGRQVFMEQIGPGLIDVEFQKILTPPAPKFASAKIHFALNGTPRDGQTKTNLSRRLVYTPDRLQMRRAYRMAREGDVASELLMEVVFPNVFEEGWAPPNGSLGAGWLHPLPYTTQPDEKLREKIQAAALSTIEKIAPGAGDRLEAIDVALSCDIAEKFGLAPEGFASAQSVLAEAQRARALRGASGLKGIFFCGPEAQVGRCVSGSAGKSAGIAALRYSRREVAA